MVAGLQAGSIGPGLLVYTQRGGSAATYNGPPSGPGAPFILIRCGKQSNA